MSKPEDPAATITALMLLGMGVCEIAARTKLSRTSIYRIADGSTKNPSFATASKLLQLRDVTASRAAMPKVGTGIVTRKG